jgi:hypothetical protein
MASRRCESPANSGVAASLHSHERTRRPHEIGSRRKCGVCLGRFNRRANHSSVPIAVVRSGFLEHDDADGLRRRWHERSAVHARKRGRPPDQHRRQRCSHSVTGCIVCVAIRNSTAVSDESRSAAQRSTKRAACQRAASERAAQCCRANGDSPSVESGAPSRRYVGYNDAEPDGNHGIVISGSGRCDFGVGRNELPPERQRHDAVGGSARAGCRHARAGSECLVIGERDAGRSRDPRVQGAERAAGKRSVPEAVARIEDCAL